MAVLEKIALSAMILGGAYLSIDQIYALSEKTSCMESPCNSEVSYGKMISGLALLYAGVKIREYNYK